MKKNSRFLMWSLLFYNYIIAPACKLQKQIISFC